MSCNISGSTGVANNISSVADVWASNMNTPTQAKTQMTTEEYIKTKALREDQLDYMFINRVIKEITNSCALNLPIRPASIPPFIIQAAQWFWQNCDFSIEERYYCIKNSEFQRCGPNTTIKLPPQIISVFGVNKLNDSFNYGVLGDFSLERMIMNNSALANGVGGTLTDVFGSGTGYSLTDVVASLYEVQTFKAIFDVPLSFNFNEFSHELVILGDLGYSDVLLQTFKRLKLQDMYNNYYFFRLVVAFCLRNLGTILGTMTFKLPGGVEINYDRFNTLADNYKEEVEEWVKENHSVDYMVISNSI